MIEYSKKAEILLYFDEQNLFKNMLNAEWLSHSVFGV